MEPSTRRLLLAGSFGPERWAGRVDDDEPRWFEPLHVRDAPAARDRIAAQVASGADIVMAPTWQTHRRALLPVGETRRAREWTRAAVDVARQGIEEGLERRAVAAQEHVVADDDADQAAAERPQPLVAGTLPLLDEHPEHGSGRLAPPDVAAERDYLDQAGLLSDAEVDFILVEGQRTVSGTQAAVGAAAATGLPAWDAAISGLTPRHREAPSLQRWIDACVQAGATTLLAPAATSPGATEAIAVTSERVAASGLEWGSQLDAARDLREAADAWIETSGVVLAILDGATTAAVATVRAALDATERADLAVATSERERWRAFVAAAARMAPGGAALWIDARPTESEASPPDGFEWLVATPGELPQMPRDHFRLIVDASGNEDSAHVGAMLEEGGLFVTPLRGSVADVPDLRLLRIDDSHAPTLAAFRREH